MKKTKTVDDYIAAETRWPDEVRRLREIILPMGLTEEVKWGIPCYTMKGRNVVGIGAFKSYFGLWFYEGAQLEDKNGVLVNAQEGKTRALRQWRMNAPGDIKPAIIRRYVKEAAANAAAGKRTAPTKKPALAVPAELDAAFSTREAAKSAFAKLRPAQRREYCEFVASAKRADTRLRRVKKIIPMIKKGIGLNDRYR